MGPPAANKTDGAGATANDSLLKVSSTLQASGQFDAASPGKTNITSKGPTTSAKNAAKAIPVQYLVEYLDRRVVADKFYTTLWIYLPFVALFFVFYLNGRDIETNHMGAGTNHKLYLQALFPNAMQNALNLNAQGFTDDPRLPEDKRFATIRSAKDFHEWLRSVLIPNTWDCEHPKYSRQTLTKRGQLQYIGAMKLRFHIVRNTSCVSATEVAADFVTQALANTSLVGGQSNTVGHLPVPCFAAGGDGAHLDSAPRCNMLNPALPGEMLWRYTTPEMDKTTPVATGQLYSYGAGGYVATIPFNATCNEVMALHSLITDASANPDCVLSREDQMRFAAVEWFQYGSQTDTFFMGKLFFEVTSGGSWVMTHQLRMFPVWTLKRLFQSVFDILFFLYVMYFLYRLIYEWVLFYRKERRVLAFLFDVWNLLEIANVLTFIGVVVLRWIWWTTSQSSRIAFPFAQTFPGDLDQLALIFSYGVYANSVNAVLCVLKILKFVQLNNRLNILTRTMQACQSALVGVLVLFVFVVLGYCICSTILFGANMESFRNINTSFSSLLFMLLGEFDYPAMRALNPTFAGMFFFSYVILGNFLLLNFIVAVLGDGFGAICEDTYLEPLDVAFLNSLNSLIRFFSFKNLKKIFELRKQGKNRNDLLVIARRYIMEQLDILTATNPEILDSDYNVYLKDLQHWLPMDLYGDLGDTYLSFVWVDCYHELELDRMTQSYQVRKEIEDIVVAATAPERYPLLKVMGREMKRLEAGSFSVVELTSRVIDGPSAASDSNSAAGGGRRGSTSIGGSLGK